MLRSDFEKTEEEYKPTMLYTNEDISGLKNSSDTIVAIHNKEEMKDAFLESMSIMYVTVVTVFSIA